MAHGITGRPQSVDIAVRFLFASLAASALRSVFLEWSVLQTNHPAVNTFFSAFFLGITLWLIVMIIRGHTWARTAYLGWFLIGLPVYGLEVYHVLTKPITGSLGFLSSLLSLAALVLLYRGESTAWFKKAKSAESS